VECGAEHCASAGIHRLVHPALAVDMGAFCSWPLVSLLSHARVYERGTTCSCTSSGS
jgi:hypothetical protein